MAFDDKEFGTLFPTRNGVAQGSSRERQMLDNLGGAGSFRTQIRNNPDGSTTMLRTRNGMPEFTTTTAIREYACELFMNSGIVDLIGAGSLDPNLDLPGEIYQTDYVATAGSGDIVGGGKMTITTKGANVTFDLEGALPANGSEAQSFSDKAGEYMLKKTTAWNVPSSIFTGRTRLYVQALYGGVDKSIILSQGSSARPTLGITTQARSETGAPPVLIGTGTGLFFDTVTLKHWLILPDSSSALIVKLRSSACGEKLRQKLGDMTISEAERERVEAYILSMSIPDLPTIQEVSYDTTPIESMGYSWHWNWDGDTCDIVDVVETAVRPGIYGFESTHYRLSFSCADGVFSVSRSVVAETSAWSVPKNINVIAYPDWYSSQLVKAGNLTSGISDANQSGLVYCFYKKNELKLVSYAGTFTAHSAQRISSPMYFGSEKWETQPGTNLAAFESGVSHGSSSWDGMSHKFSCDGVEVGGENGSSVEDEYSGSWVGRSLFGERSNNQVTGSPFTFNYGVASTQWEYNYLGFPVPIGTVEYEGSITVGVGGWWHPSNGKDTYQYGAKFFTRVRGAYSLIVIPFMDAQAVYMSGETVYHETGTQSSAERYLYIDNYYGNFNWTWPLGENVSETYNKYEYAELKYLPTTSGAPAPSVAIDEIYSSQQGCTLICSHGTFEAIPADISPFYSSLDAVSQSWGTLSSANGVVQSSSNNVYSGSPIYPLYSSLVGWA